MFRSQVDYTKGGQPTNATWTGDWIQTEILESVAFLVIVPGASNPTAVWTVELSNDPDANRKADANLIQVPTSVALTAAQATDANPAGAGVAINARLQFEGVGSTLVGPALRAKFARLKYTRSGGGAAGTGLSVSFSGRGAA